MGFFEFVVGIGNYVKVYLEIWSVYFDERREGVEMRIGYVLSFYFFSFIEIEFTMLVGYVFSGLMCVKGFVNYVYSFLELRIFGIFGAFVGSFKVVVVSGSVFRV